MKETFLVTGAAGFIGAALSLRLLEEGNNVIGLDNINSYYETSLKKARVKLIEEKLNLFKGRWFFYEKSLEDFHSLEKIFKEHQPKIIFNMAAQAGVRYSLINPSSYISSNIVGFSNILELSKLNKIKNLVYASSSSVYGKTNLIPFNEDNNVDHPISLYAATKKSNELLAHTYSHLYKLPSTGLRFFTVYGPWGRPDMAPMIFTKAIIEKKPISIFNYGNMKRDFTYIDDIVEGIIRCGFKPATIDSNFDYKSTRPSTSFAPHRVFNIGRGEPIDLLNFIEIIEEELNLKAKKIYKKIQPGDVENTHADTTKLKEWINFKPKISIKDGIKKFILWYKKYYI